MGIAGVEPRQLASTMGTTGSGSTGSPAPSSSSRRCKSHLAYSSGAELIIVGQTASSGFNLVDLNNNNDGSSSRQSEALISLPASSVFTAPAIIINISYVRNPRRDPISGAVLRAAQLSKVPRILISAKDQAGITARSGEKQRSDLADLPVLSHHRQVRSGHSRFPKGLCNLADQLIHACV
jgi:hypothetical protein